MRVLESHSMRSSRFHRPSSSVANRTPGANSRHRRRAVAAVEFALVAPLFGLLVTGMFEISQALIVRTVLADAARAGCQAGTYPLRDNSYITHDVNDVLTINKINSSAATNTVQVNGQPGDVKNAKKNDKISVKVSIPFSQVAWTTSFLFMGKQSIESSTVIMLREG